MEQFIQNDAGIKSLHKDKLPVFEKKYTPPDYGDQLISRLYDDGSLYYLNLSRNKNESQIKEENWNFIIRISSESVNAIQNKINSICERGTLELQESSSNGEFDWKLNCNSEILHFHFFGLPQGEGLIFSEIDGIINKG